VNIGVFDSGLGGLTVLRSLVARQCFQTIIYYGDTARVPYGSKDRDTVVRYALEALSFFANHQIDMLVVACNTVSVVALEVMHKVADYPVVGVVEPGVHSLVNAVPDRQSRVLVIGTRSTIHSGQYQRSLQSMGYQSVDACAAPLLVSLVEEGIHEGPVMDAVLDHYFAHQEKPDAVILGCTHFPMIAAALRRYWGDVVLVHSGEAIVEWLDSRGYLGQTTPSCQVEFFASENTPRVRQIGEAFLADVSDTQDAVKKEIKGVGKE